MLTIYTPQVTNRIRYIFDLIFKESLGIEFEVTGNKDEFLAKPEPKICYDKQTIEDALCFGAVFLLFEKGIKEQSFEMDRFEDIPTFFQVKSEDSCLPFDPFAASFYQVSRYEEYLPHIKDNFGRFPAKNSLAYKHNFLEKPLVNYYINIIRQKLADRFPDLKIVPTKYKFTPTYDIDSAYAYLNKGLIRNVGGLIRSIIELDTDSVINRLLVLTQQKNDPFDTYDLLEKLHQKYSLRPIYFFLVGDYDEYDKNISLSIGEFQTLIKSIADYADVGIHPSFASNTAPEKLRKEIQSLSSVLKRDIRKSRQHFLKLDIPKTYQSFIEHDIEEDYTMGYASHPGFRAGICHPFYFYNLETENKTQLKIHPFSVMDATLNYYMGHTPQQAIETITSIIEQVKQVNGTFISLWHNSSLSEEKEWVGWRKVYQTLVEKATPRR